LEFESSKRLNVYVVNEDEHGESYLLFPLPGYDLQNPLRPNARHLLPGQLAGELKRWQVTSAGDREHFLVVASPKRLVEFEDLLAGLAQPQPVGDGMPTAIKLPEETRARLRGVGGIASPTPTQGAAPTGNLFAMAQRLADKTETTRGVWVRQIDLDNPQ
jgi:hypothetical protein